MKVCKLLRHCTIVLLLFTAFAFAGFLNTLDTLWVRFISPFQFLPEYHLEADLSSFLLHTNGFFKKRYFLESNTNLEFVLISVEKRVYSVWDFEFQTGMGQTPGNVIFDPMDINFGIVPSIELRMKPVNIQAGVEHHCFHEIDRKDFKTVYWNKVYAGIGSPNMRLNDYWQTLIKDDSWTYANRFSWYFRWGYYMREFFDLVDPVTINGENGNIHEARLDARYAFYKRRSWIVNAYGRTKVGQWRAPDSTAGASTLYWAQEFGIENNLRVGVRGAMLFAKYTLDDLPLYQGLPRFSKDRLLQIGIRFFI